MKTLFPNNFNWPAYFLTLIVVRILFLGMSWLSFIAIMIALYQFIILFNSISTIIPTRHLLGSFMCVQFFIGPVLAYNGLDEYQYFMYKMRITESAYFQYAIPAVTLFIIGLHLNAGKYRGEVVDLDQIEAFVKKNKKIPYIFIGIGLFSSIIGSYFSNDLAFVFYLLGSFKFIGLFLIIIGTKRLQVLPLIIVIGSIISSSFGNGMFHDLLTWIIYSASIFAIKYKFDFKVKAIGLTSFILFAVILQVLKGNYRAVTGVEKGKAGIETFAEIYQKENEKKGVFSFENLATSNVRINQGFIITNIMTNVPDKVEHANGSEMYQILEAAILPRILAPNKLNAGDRTIFVKYSGIPLTEGTSMGLSSLGDAYINYGISGGIIFMFLFGVFYSYVLNVFYKNSKEFPILILFTALVFYYPIRPDCELQTILGHLFKACFLIFVMIQTWKYTFKAQPLSN